MSFLRKNKDDLRTDIYDDENNFDNEYENNFDDDFENENEIETFRKKKELSRKERKKEKKREKAARGFADPELAARLREYGENYGLEEDPYLEGLSNAIEDGKNLSVWASNDVMTLLPHPDVDSVEGPVYSAMVLVRNVLVFVPVALTWLAVGKATTAFSAYTAQSSATSIVNFLQFWQNGYGLLSPTWTLSHVAQLDFYVIGTVIFLTFVTPFMNRSAVKKASRFEQDALRERLALVIEVESFLFDKRRLTPLTIDSALAQSFERVVDATHNLMVASKRIEAGLKALPRMIDELREAQRPSIEDEDEFRQLKPITQVIDDEDLDEEQTPQDSDPFDRFDQFEQIPLAPIEVEFGDRDSNGVEQAAVTLDDISKRVDIIVQSLPRRAHARKELKKVEVEIGNTRADLEILQAKLKKRQKKALKQTDWKAEKREAERNKALGRPKTLGNGTPRFIEGE